MYTYICYSTTQGRQDRVANWANEYRALQKKLFFLSIDSKTFLCKYLTFVFMDTSHPYVSVVGFIYKAVRSHTNIQGRIKPFRAPEHVFNHVLVFSSNHFKTQEFFFINMKLFTIV